MKIRIYGQSDKQGVPRRLDIQLFESEVRLSIGQIDSNEDEESIRVPTATLLRALHDAPATQQRLVGASSTGNRKSLDIERRESHSIYLWIRTEESDGWEITVPRFELVDA